MNFNLLLNIRRNKISFGIPASVGLNSKQLPESVNSLPSYTEIAKSNLARAVPHRGSRKILAA